MEKVEKVYPTILQAIGFVLINLVLLALLVSVPVKLLGDQLPQSALFLIGYVLAMSVTLYFGKKLRQRTLGPLPPFFEKIDFRVVILIILATVTLNLGIVLPITDFIPISDFFKDALLQTFGDLDGFMFIAMVFGAPFFEEYLHRGIILDGLLKNYAPWVAILTSSFLFCIIHVNPAQLVSAGLGGLFLGWVYYKSKNLTYCFLIHLMINLIGFVFFKMVSIEQVLEKGYMEVIGGSGNYLLLFSVSTACIISCIYSLNKLFQENNQTI